MRCKIWYLILGMKNIQAIPAKQSIGTYQRFFSKFPTGIPVLIIYEIYRGIDPSKTNWNINMIQLRQTLLQFLTTPFSWAGALPIVYMQSRNPHANSETMDRSGMLWDMP